MFTDCLQKRFPVSDIKQILLLAYQEPAKSRDIHFNKYASLLCHTYKVIHVLPDSHVFLPIVDVMLIPEVGGANQILSGLSPEIQNMINVVRKIGLVPGG